MRRAGGDERIISNSNPAATQPISRPAISQGRNQIAHSYVEYGGPKTVEGLKALTVRQGLWYYKGRDQQELRLHLTGRTRSRAAGPPEGAEIARDNRSVDTSLRLQYPHPSLTRANACRSLAVQNARRRQAKNARARSLGTQELAPQLRVERVITE